MWFIMVSMVLMIGVSQSSDIYFPDDESTQFSSRQEIAQQTTNSMPSFDIKISYDKFVDDMISQGVTNLCLAVDRTVASSKKEVAPAYVVYSPLSMASALALVLLGANGKTFDELSNLLGLAHGLNIANNSIQVHEEFGQLLDDLENSPPQDTQQIKFASAIFLQNDYPVREQYRSSSRIIYKSETMNLDFKNNPEQAKNIINSWVSDKTMGKIKQILFMDPSTDTKAVIVSSLYFKSDWDNPFDSSITKRQPFYPDGKEQGNFVKVDMMANGGDYPYYDDSVLGCQILGLPYKGKTATFYIVIPHNSNKAKLRDLENRLTASELRRLVKATRKTPTLVAVPKMKLTTTLQLNSILQNLGLRSLFDPQESNLALLSPGQETGRQQHLNHNDDSFVFPSRSGAANSDQTGSDRKREVQSRSRIIGTHTYENSLDYIRNMLNKNSYGSNPGLYADQVLHKVYIDVTEKGTEAAAATGISLSRDGSRIIFKADVPFFFFIHHEQTNLLLFWGSVNTPAPNYT